MKRHWLTAFATLVIAAGAAQAEEKTPQAEKPQAPVVPVTQSLGQAADASKPVQVAESTLPSLPLLGQAPATPAEEKKPEPPPAPKFTYGGSADFYFSTNFNDPFTGNNGPVRAFDWTDEQGPHLGLIDLWAQYARDPVGFRLDLDWGTTARFVNAFEPTGNDVWEHIQQAYIGVNLNKAGTTYLEAGKWVTTAGFEVIEPKDNWLYTRGLLFNLAIPFYHAGIRGYHYFNGTDYVMAGVERGWNAVSDPDHAPGFVLAGSKAINDKLTLTGNYYGGDEFGPSGKGYRNLFDFIATYNANPKWSYAANFDLVEQQGDTLFGLAAYAKYNLNTKSYLAARGEVLIDDGFLGSDLYSVTLGYTYAVNKYFQTKAEFRYDFGSNDIFPSDTFGKFKGNQGTFLISAIVSY
jgi:hypothetical protein